MVMFMKGKMTDLMVHVAYEGNKKWQKILYMRVQKALYGMLKRALLFNEKLSHDLETQGFKINPYDSCLANKLVDGYQMTGVWYVDDLKISYKHPWEMTKIALWLSKIYTVT